jgi:hypothetical protein
MQVPCTFPGPGTSLASHSAAPAGGHLQVLTGPDLLALPGNWAPSWDSRAGLATARCLPAPSGTDPAALSPRDLDFVVSTALRRLTVPAAVSLSRAST